MQRSSLFTTRFRPRVSCWWLLCLLSGSLTALLPPAPHGVAQGAEDLADTGLFAGAFAQDITPTQFPISLNGGMSDRLVSEVHDPLHARCLVLQNGETRLVLVTVDSCMVPREILDQAKSEASEQTGIPTNHMLISSTHSHSCPTVMSVFQSEPDQAYIEFLIQKIVAGIVEADRRKVPAQIGYGKTENAAHLFNRRWKLRSGTTDTSPLGRTGETVRMNPGYQNPDVDTPSGPIDPDVSVLAVQTRTGEPLAVYASYSLHYVGGVPGDFVSADYFGEFAVRLKRLLGQSPNSPFVPLLANGTSGNINNVNFAGPAPTGVEPYEQISFVAEEIARSAEQVYRTLTFHTNLPLGIVERELTLGVRQPTPTEVAAAVELVGDPPRPGLGPLKEVYARETYYMAQREPTELVRLQVLRIGGLCIATIPCETFVETGLALKQQSPADMTFTVSLANGASGYLPTAEHHEWGGYETWRARSSYLEVDAEATIRSTLQDMLQEISR